MTRCKMQEAGGKMQDAGCKMQDVGRRWPLQPERVREAGKKRNSGIRYLGFCFLLLASCFLLLTACSVPRLGAQFLPPEHTLLAAPTTTPTLTPGPSETPAPTLCAHARISGQTCVAHATVRISSCCPEWYAETLADEVGAFEFDNITAGDYTVSAGGRSWDVTLNTCYSQASVNLCPPPTHPPLAR